MTVSTLAHPTAPTPNEAEAARLLLLAHNSLTQALRSLRRTDTSPEALRAATGRAARAATLMRRLCELTGSAA